MDEARFERTGPFAETARLLAMFARRLIADFTEGSAPRIAAE